MKVRDMNIKWDMEIVDAHGTYLIEHEYGRTEACKLDADNMIWEVLRRVPRRFSKTVRQRLRAAVK